MRSTRLNRLSILTQGVALVGLGISGAACSKEAPPKEEVNINAPPTPTLMETATAVPVASEVPAPSVSAPPKLLPRTNSVPVPLAPPSASTSDRRPLLQRIRPTMNAPRDLHIDVNGPNGTQ